MTGPLARRDRLSERQVGQLVELYQEEWWTRGRTKAEVEIMLRNSPCLFAYVDAADHLVAFARVMTDGVFKAFLFDVIVSRAFRGQGVGDRLMHDVIQHPLISRVKHLELYCRPELTGFYRRHGFSSEVGEIGLMRRTAGP